MTVDRDYAKKMSPDLEKLNLKTNVWKALGYDGRFKTIGALLLASDEELLEIPNFGIKAITHIRECLRHFNENLEAYEELKRLEAEFKPIVDYPIMVEWILQNEEWVKRFLKIYS